MHAVLQFGQRYVEEQDDKTVTEWMDKQARACKGGNGNMRVAPNARIVRLGAEVTLGACRACRGG